MGCWKLSGDPVALRSADVTPVFYSHQVIPLIWGSNLWRRKRLLASNQKILGCFPFIAPQKIFWPRKRERGWVPRDQVEMMDRLEHDERSDNNNIEIYRAEGTTRVTEVGDFCCCTLCSASFYSVSLFPLWLSVIPYFEAQVVTFLFGSRIINNTLCP